MKNYINKDTEKEYQNKGAIKLNNEEIYDELEKIAKWLHDEIVRYNFNPSGHRKVMINTPAVNSLTKAFDMVYNLGIKLEENKEK